MSDIADLDVPIWGATQIALAAGLVLPDGTPDLDRAYYKLRRNYLPARKVGREYVTTRRQLLDGLLNNPGKFEAV